MTRFRLVLMLLSVLALAVFAGCGSSDESSDDSSTSTTASTTVSLDDCQAADLDTYKDGVLTVGTDSPAYPPYFEDDDPSNGKGFESAVAFAIGEKLVFDISAAAGAGEFDDSAAVPATGDITGGAIAMRAGLNTETTCLVKLTPGNATKT